MKSAAEDSSYLPMKDHDDDYLNESNPSYLIPQSTAHHDDDDNDDDDDDDDDDAVKTLQPAAAAENTNNTSLMSSTQDNAEKPLLSRPNHTVPQMKYSALKQYSH